MVLFYAREFKLQKKMKSTFTSLHFSTVSQEGNKKYKNKEEQEG
jgi:hypothetical protein